MRAQHQAFFSSPFFARLADQILLFLVPLVIFQTTGRVSWSGIAFSLETFPRYLCFPVLGALCDRYSPTKLMHISQTLRAAVCVVGVIGYDLIGGIGWLIALSALCGMLTSQGIVAREVMLPQIFSSHRFEKVLSYSQLADQLGMVLGPMLAAILLSWWRWEFVVAAAAVLFFAADIALAYWQKASAFEFSLPEGSHGTWLKPIKTALAHVIHLPGLKSVILLAAAENLVIGVTLATSAAMVTGFHHQNGHHYAGLQTAGACVTIAILLATARLHIPRHILGLVGFIAICVGGAIAAASPGIAGYVFGFLLIVGFDKMFNVYIRSTRQKIIPARDYGKTTGVVILLNNMTQPLAGLAVGAFSTPLGPNAVILVLSLCMGGLGLLVWLAPRIRKNRHPSTSTGEG
ncbi:MFS transporter [Pandoraea pulmonicola]|uniref:H+ Antiporter protein n=1 Tax=Pandoraea pulmonicola TaxID=93221 RepID=A0AAJ4ZHB1_PANPU|nr:MFS transporter [Pandoraea pulmonicola]AJC22588.1 MFS transporter [Pandoraea pulmonicola]SUA93211.1 H+ Antiporter protein [Pandoraea pulmonicola]